MVYASVVSCVCLFFYICLYAGLHGLPFLLYMDIRMHACMVSCGSYGYDILQGFSPGVFYVLCLPIYGQVFIMIGLLYMLGIPWLPLCLPGLLCLVLILYGYSQPGIVYFGLLWLPDLLWSPE